jgi:hypothetical protein
MALVGKHKTLKLKHGDRERDFSNVTVRKFKPYQGSDEERYELTGTEHKWVALNKGNHRIEEVIVTVGFNPEDIVPSDAN